MSGTDRREGLGKREIETQEMRRLPRRPLGRKLLVVKASTDHDFEVAFATLAALTSVAIAPRTDLNQIVALAASHKMPAIYILRQCPEAGGLMSYGTKVMPL